MIVRKNPGAPECMLTEMVMEEMELTSEIWIPPL